MTTKVTGSMIEAATIDTANLVNLSVTAIKLASGAALSNIGNQGITASFIADSNVTPAKLTQPFTQATALATTSGTSKDFTNIPSWVKRVTISFAGVSTSGTSQMRVRIGPSGGVETTGYVGSSLGILNAVGAVIANHSAGFDLYDGAAANVTRSGAYILTLVDASTNTWALQGGIGESASARYDSIAGHKALAGALSIVRITTVNGTDTFDAGSVNIMYE